MSPYRSRQCQLLPYEVGPTPVELGLTRVNFFALLAGQALYSQESRAIVKIHERAGMSGTYKGTLQFVKKYRPIRPRVPLLSEAQPFPLP
jgi:hypothetical protein